VLITYIALLGALDKNWICRNVKETTRKIMLSLAFSVAFKELRVFFGVSNKVALKQVSYSLGL